MKSIVLLLALVCAVTGMTGLYYAHTVQWQVPPGTLLVSGSLVGVALLYLVVDLWVSLTSA